MSKLVFSIVMILVLMAWIVPSIKKDRKRINIDMIIRFKNKNLVPDITKSKKLMDVANWKREGQCIYRGFSSLNKEDVSKLLTKEYDVKQDDFEISLPSGLYFGSTLFKL